MSIKEKINFKVYGILFTAALFGAAAIIPYILILQKSNIVKSGLSIEAFIGITILQTTINIAILLFLGLLMIHTTGFKIPYITALANREKIKDSFSEIFTMPAFLGITAGILIIAGDFIFKKFGIAIKADIETIAWWKGFLASFYGGIVEEILIRLFLMTLIIWIIMKVTQATIASPKKTIIWIAIIGAALVFGAAHLPAVAALTKVTPSLVTRTLVLNGIGGIIFGWLFWKRGLEAAMISHFSADIIIHVITPLIGKAVS